MVKNQPVKLRMQVQALGQDDTLEQAGNGNPPQYSCLGNFMDRGAQEAIVHGVSHTLATKQQQGTSSKWTHTVFVLLWLISLCIMSSLTNILMNNVIE